MQTPIDSRIAFHAGPVPVDEVVVVTWAIMALLAIASLLLTRKLQRVPGRGQAILETVLQAMEQQITQIMHRAPGRYLPLLGTLFLFLLCANLAGLVPGTAPPTAHLETPAALAAVVFFSVHVFGIRARGVRAYLKEYLRPNPLLLPLNVLSEITRTFSLMIRLFGNIMSHELVIGIVVALAGLVVPVAFMALGVLIGVIQAYIFTVLAAVFIASGLGSSEKSSVKGEAHDNRNA